MGPFDGYEANSEPMASVIDQHRDAHQDLERHLRPSTPHNDKTWADLSAAAESAWTDCSLRGASAGFRNAQVSVLAPTGTIAFMMDCDTTGIEPDLALVKYKRLVGGGSLALVNQVVEDGLRHLGYPEDAVDTVRDYVKTNGRVEGCPVVQEKDLPVFDCSFRAVGGTRVLSPMAHVKMMAAVQPFLSGAISKTVNVPNDATVEDIENLYIEAWRRGVKALAIYRDGCKKTQPLSTSESKASSLPTPKRRRLSDERQAICHKFSIGGHDGYLHLGMYEDGSLGEMFIRMAKEGSTISGMMDAFALSVSLGLQHGVPLETFISKFKHTRFEPSGFTSNPDVRMAQSVIDYLFRYMEHRFLGVEQEEPEERIAAPALVEEESIGFINQTDAPPCSTCGNLTVRNGSCYKCPTCGSSNGCS